MGTDDFFLMGKAAEAWSWPLATSSAEVENKWSYPPPHICLHGKHRDNLTFTVTMSTNV
jgi:hypothetical protein